MTPQEIAQTLDFLHDYQKWRRGADTEMPNPKEIGLVLDNVIRLLRSMKYYGVVSKKDVIDRIEITKGAMILDGYEVYDSCIKYMNELEKEIEEL